ncbi:SDR family oxidoreductase [Streptomyces sp. JJ66]|uniref:SDR family oxidoreductase n=1 Tax=Streptomyces sp. JJ66 TaxID=2803843 RepID=UPI001C588E69|nr:SDR family oxidoreductase [Streptomyces sp. JJ66]MBW1602239.1 SDR family oxidoreductase [Streptomyces sp. JJ66]
MTGVRTVLLTGAGGVVGQSLLREAGTAGRAMRMIATARRPVALPDAARVVTADVTRPRLGLSPSAYRELAAETDVVIHSAGLTEWGLPAAAYEPVNVRGTRHVAEFALRAGAPVHFISTAFVAAVLPGAHPPLGDGNVTAAYVRSKLAAERLLREAGVPHTVFRPTNLIGDAATGKTSRGQIVQLLSDWICRGRAPFLPVHQGNRIDVVPQDLLSHAVLAAIGSDLTRGEFWVTYGAEAMDMEAALGVCAEHLAARGGRLNPPPVVDPDSEQARNVGHLPPATRSYLAVLRDVSDVTRSSGGVLPTSMPELRERFGLPRVADTDAYRRTLRYAAGIAARAGA